MSKRALFLSWFTVIAMGATAWIEGNFTAGQMAARGLEDGFPFIRHTGMWGELVPVTIAVGIMCSFARRWKAERILNKLLASAIVTLVLHFVWSGMTTVQEHILGPGLTFTASGLIHAFYMTGVLTIVLLFYSNAEPALEYDKYDARFVTAWLMVHIPLSIALVGLLKSGHFDAPGVIGTLLLMVALFVAHVRKFE